MSESMGEHHTHHSSSKGNDFSLYVLPLSILLAAVIVGWSLMSAATSLGNSLDGLSIAAPNGSDNTVPTPSPDQGNAAPAGPTQKMAELAQKGAGSMGSESAPIVMVEYSDYQCPFCRVWFNQSEAKIIQNFVDTGKVQFVYKDFPLSFHPMAAPSANAARCAGDQGKYWEFHDKLYDAQTALDPSGSTVQYSVDDIKKWGKEIGLNESTFNSCVDNNTHASEVQANAAEGQAVGVGGTPSFVVGLRDETGQLVVGAQPYATFEAALNALVQQAGN